MSKEEYDAVYVSDILDAIANIEEFTARMGKEEFFKNKIAKFATVRALEIQRVGEDSLLA